MIISTFHVETNANIKVALYHAPSTEPFILHFSGGNSIHLSLNDAERLHLELTAALYEYDTDYKHKETS